MSQIEAISLIEASKQALEALEWCSRRYAGCGPSFIPESITSLRAAIASYSQAIAEAEKQDPHSWYSAQEDEWMTEKTRKEHERLNSYTHKVGGFDLPLYTHPQPKRRAEQHTEAEPSRSDIKQSTECVEPVAWMRNDKFKAMTDVEKQAWIAADDYWSDLVKDYTIPLYTTPYVLCSCGTAEGRQQRKPLTVEQIRKASLEAGMQEHYMDFHSGFIRFARAIEAAHGITGETK
jgi:hypothetical protein